MVTHKYYITNFWKLQDNKVAHNDDIVMFLFSSTKEVM